MPRSTDGRQFGSCLGRLGEIGIELQCASELIAGACKLCFAPIGRAEMKMVRRIIWCAAHRVLEIRQGSV